MVQRKAADKLGIKTDTKYCPKSEKSKTSSSQKPEARNMGGNELKKIMKKSRSVKRSDFDTLQVSSAVRQGAKVRADHKPKPKTAATPATDALVAVATPQKPPSAMVTPQKPPRAKIPETPPNYMKSTSCSAARKERRSCDGKSSSKKESISSKLSSASGHKSGRTLTKTSSLRPVRTLTKTSSNKAGRTSIKKNSGVALYADQHVRNDTCSSTLKDSKFPPYVALQPGGTESEGFSVMKVCPYIYCSLNGHHRAQLPPLKTFLAAKRQSLKTQKSLKLESPSPLGRKPSEVPKKDIDTGQMVFKDSAESVSPSINEEGLDFFVEIFTPPREISTDESSKGIKTDDREDGLQKEVYGDPCGFENTSYSAKDGDGTEVGNKGGRYAESLPDDPTYSAISFEDNINRFVMEDIDLSMFFLEYNQKQEIEDRDGLGSDTHGDTCVENYHTGYESGETEIDDASEMDWDEEDKDTSVHNKVDAPIITSEALVCLKEFKEAVLTGEEVQFVHGESEYHDEQFEDADYNLEILLSSVIYMEEIFDKSIEISEEKNVENETDQLITSGTSPEIVEDEQNANSSEPEAKIVPGDDLDSRANLKDCLLESETVDFETDQGVCSTEDPSVLVLPIPDVNVENGANDEDQAEVNERYNNSSAFLDGTDSTQGFNLKPVAKSSDDVTEMEVEDITKATKTRTIDECMSNQECPEDCIKFNIHTRCKKKTEDSEEPREFNPRGPNFLPVEPEPNPETVDLRHQTMDERKNSEEWMVDYALRRAVNKLAPARKRKVALLVEAFETVLPIPKYEIRLPHTPTGFAQARYMQACN